MIKLCRDCQHEDVALEKHPCNVCSNVENGDELKWEPIQDTYEAPSALDVQVAGDHYKGKGIQPVEYISANKLTFLEGCIVKRITRWRDKQSGDKFDDLHKIKHEIDLLIEMEKKYGTPS
jgi:hypothetical protein